MRHRKWLSALVVIAACSSTERVTQTQQNARDDETCEPDDNNCECPGSPIVIDIEGDGIALSSAENGVPFHLRQRQLRFWAWPDIGSDDVLLAMDTDNDGRISHGGELFGNYTLQSIGGDRNGFSALAFYDLPSQGGNGDGWITSADTVYASLRLWSDRAPRDGISQASELMPLANGGVHGISLSYTEETDGTIRFDQHGNELRYKAAITADAPVGQVAYDVWFVNAPVPAVDSTNSTFLGYRCTVTCHYTRQNPVTHLPYRPYVPCNSPVYSIVEDMIDPQQGYQGRGTRNQLTRTITAQNPSETRLRELRTDLRESCLGSSPTHDSVTGERCQGALMGIPDEPPMMVCVELWAPPPPPPPPGPCAI